MPPREVLRGEDLLHPSTWKRCLRKYVKRALNLVYLGDVPKHKTC
jgi:hypothetical protein